MRTPDYSHEAVELQLHMESDRDAYRAYYLPANRNLYRHYKAGRFDRERGIRGMRYAVDAAAKSYHRQHGSPWESWSSVFQKADRDRVAEYFVDVFLDAVRCDDLFWVEVKK